MCAVCVCTFVRARVCVVYIHVSIWVVRWITGERFEIDTPIFHCTVSCKAAGKPPNDAFDDAVANYLDLTFDGKILNQDHSGRLTMIISQMVTDR